MKCSIITINYNNCIGLQRTLKSIASQTYKEYEWIVIDGGSTDGSRELIERHQNIVAYWCSEPDKGIYHAMNKGVCKAQGDYCLFLNSGDILCNSRVMDDLMAVPFKADIVSCDIYIDGIGRRKLRKSVDKINTFWIYDNTLYHQSTWIRQDVLVKNPFHEEYRTISDWVFFFEAFTLYGCSYQHIPMAISVFYKGGLSNDPIFYDEAYRNKFDYLKKHFPVQYVDDKENIESFHYISMNMGRMTLTGKSLMHFFYRIVMFADIRIMKPLSHLLNL